MDDEMSFETLFEVLMREKNREELQRIDQDFFDEALRFINAEQDLVHPSNHVGFQRVRNLRNMLSELYSRREQKVVRLALMTARGSGGQVDRAAMLDHEKELFTEMSQALEQTRNRRLQGKPRPPRPKPVEVEDEEDEPLEEKKPEKSTISQKVTVVFTKGVGKFMGEELEPYGPFEEGDSAKLPRSIAEILVQKGEAKIE